ncbi:uncharacterized protein LOC110722988 [Chenopodium quinoa]|uniref:uncharacterized protein LOC110722988 n=1 Tax=Chenopodium quinoa TaxID=63459 RepID=UPI000B772B72|nr:uncharacterized protein LOC110722988 [Chenopodium quinoa]
MEDKFLPLKRSRLLMDEDGDMHHTALTLSNGFKLYVAIDYDCVDVCLRVLSVFPKGNKQEQVDDHLSVYVTLVDKLNPGSFVDVVLRFFLYDHLRDAYLSVLDVRERRFHVLKDTWGVPKFLSVSTFNDADYGFLVDDCCVFGAEVLVINSHFKISTMSIVQENCDRSYSWRIENFSTLNDVVCSPIPYIALMDGHDHIAIENPVFIVSDLVNPNVLEKLVLYARGSNKEKGKSLSLYLQLDDTSRLTQGNSWFTASALNWGFDDIISLNDIHDSSKGYLVDDTIIIEHRIQKMILLKDVESVKQEVLSVCPKGNNQEQGDDHLSVYVTLVDKLNPSSFVDVVLRFFLYDHLRDAYLSVLDVKGRRYHALKYTWGVTKFLPISTFNDADYGFLVDDCCVFGAEVFVINNQVKISTLSVVEEKHDRSFTWRVENFSSLNDCMG